MRYNVRYHPQKNMVAMKIEGEIELRETVIPLNRAANKMLEYSCDKLFLDLSKTSYTANEKVYMELGNIFKRIGLPNNQKQAVVIPHDFQKRKALENFCFFQGWCVRFFTDATKARQWLMVQ